MQKPTDRYKNLIETMHEFVAEVLPDGSFRYVNTIFSEDSGYASEALLGTNFFSYVHPDDRSETLHHCQNLLEKGLSIRNCEYRFRKQDGSYIHIITNGEPLYDSTGKLEAILQVSFNITRQKKSEMALQESEEKYRTLFECATEGFLLMKDAFIDCNEQLCTLWGCDREDVIGRTPLDFSPPTQPDGRPSHEAAQERIAAAIAGLPQLFYWQHLRKDGSPIDMEVSLKRIFFGGEYITQGSIRDITARMRAEAALQKSQDRHKEAQHLARLGHWNLDLLKNHLSWSDEVYRIFEIDPEKFGASYEIFLNAVHPDERDFVNNAYTESVKNKTRYDIEHRLLMKDRRVKYVNERCETFYDRAGNPSRSIGTVQDITERKEAETALRESEKRFRNIFDHSNDAILVIDAEQGRILDASPRACTMLGYAKEELLSKYTDDLHPNETVEFGDFVQSVLEEESGYSDQLTCTRKDGQILSTSLSASKIILFERTCILVIARDITEKKQAQEITRRYSEKLEQEVMERTAELEAKNKELQRFNDLFIGRELRIKELKEKVKALEKERKR